MLCLCRKLVPALIFSFLVLSFAPLAHSQQMGDAPAFTWNANVNAPLGSKINWSQDTVKVYDRGIYQEVTLSGYLPPNSQHLRLDGDPVPLGADMSFQILLGFQGSTKTFTLDYLNDKGVVISESFTLSADQIRGKSAQKVMRKNQNPPRKSFLSFGAGYTLLHYEQTHLIPFDEHVLSLKAGYQKPLPGKHWDFGFSAFYNAAILQSSTLKHSIKFLGVNGKMGYQFTPENNSVQFSLQGGLYYNTSMGDVGFTNVFGPQLYPVLTFLMNNRSAIRAYGKFSPVKSNGRAFNIAKDRELAAGISYSTFIGKQAVFFAYDYSKLDLEQDDITAALTTSTFSIGLGF